MNSRIFFKRCSLAMLMAGTALQTIQGAPATLLFEDDFNRGIPGWTQVQPAGNYIDGPLRWQYDIVSNAFLEQSNIYTDAANASPSATAPMLINDAVPGTNFTYTARLTAGDDDAFGLIFGYANANNFYRVTFTRQLRVDNGFPWNGWNVDRKINNVSTNLFGDGVDGTTSPDPSFVNTQYQPFEVTIGVTNGLFSLTVVDDPEGARVEHRLVESQLIAGLPANGKVGMFTWGQSGTALRAFRIGDLSLSPTNLAGNPNALTNWTPVVTLRADGSGLDAGSGNGGRPIWSLALGQNGAFGTLHENSDAFGGNDEAGRIDFAAPSIVAGDVNWTNYLVKARILPADDDGHGLLVRYLDECNFYRIALRNQNAATGPAKGLSIQKVVNGVFEEIYHDEIVKYDPVPNTPYEITAVVVGDRLQVLVVGNPGTAGATTHAYGPFEIGGSTVPNGKIGFFSWGMSRAEFDWVRVYSIDGVPLEVVSQYGTPEPGTGIHGFAPGTSVTATVPSPTSAGEGVRRVITGWTGLGSVPASGGANTAAFILNEISLINWLWQTEYQLTLVSPQNGTISGPAAEWIAAGSRVDLSAQANPGYTFVGWTGASLSTVPSINVALGGPLSVSARFEADADGDQLPDSWEQQFFGGTSAEANGDADTDGVSNLQEFRSGTSPIAPEPLLSSTTLTSRWENVQRDPGLPGQLVARDFGNGFRGVWENSNDYREADGSGGVIPAIPVELRIPNVSFEGPRLMVATNVWQTSWSNFTGSAIFDFGDNDGATIYFRYVNESNWHRATITAENNNAGWRAPYGLSVQKRLNGVFSELGRNEGIAGDPSDSAYYKRMRLSVTADGPNFTVSAAGWNANATPAGWDPEASVEFTDTDHANGRFGIGSWGQSGGNTATANNPVNAGMLIEDVAVSVNGATVFAEDWENVPLAAQIPDGWTNVFTGAAAGTWQMSVHGAIIQTANFAPNTTATSTSPKADAEGAILIGPEVNTSSYVLDLGFHPFDDDGIGFVFDYQDTNNFARVMFVSEVSAAGRIPQGVSVSRKTNGAWSDIVAGDTSFVYTPGRPFTARLSRTPGGAKLTVTDADQPEIVRSFNWADAAPSQETHRFGFAVWGQQDAHFTKAKVYSIALQAPPSALMVESVVRTGAEIVLQIANPSGASFDVEASNTLLPGSWNVVASNQTGTSWRQAIGAGQMFYRLVTR